ncbi:FeoA domain protein [compost metagenome]
MKRLCDFQVGEKVMIKNLLSDGLMRERMLDLGFVKGTVIEIIRKGPKNNLTVFKVRETMIALRQEESLLIEVA